MPKPKRGQRNGRAERVERSRVRERKAVKENLKDSRYGDCTCYKRRLKSAEPRATARVRFSPSFLQMRDLTKVFSARTRDRALASARTNGSLRLHQLLRWRLVRKYESPRPGDRIDRAAQAKEPPESAACRKKSPLLHTFSLRLDRALGSEKITWPDLQAAAILSRAAPISRAAGVCQFRAVTVSSWSIVVQASTRRAHTPVRHCSVTVKLSAIATYASVERDSSCQSLNWIAALPSLCFP